MSQLTIETVEDAFLYYTGRAGDVCRQLGLAGIALIWLIHSAAFKDPGQPFSAPLSGDLRIPLLLLIIGLAIDAGQYVVGTLLWGLLYMRGKAHEKTTVYTGRLWCLVVIILAKLGITFCGLGLVVWQMSKHLWGVSAAA